LNAVTNFRSV